MPQSHIRIGDQDRDRIAAQLREHFAAGRLSEDELAERLEAAYAAKTFGDLVPIMGDLPPVPAQALGSEWEAASPVPAGEGSSDAERRRGIKQGLWFAYGLAVTVNLVIWVLVSVSNGKPVYFWPMWVAGPWGAVVLMATFSDRLGRGRDGDTRKGAAGQESGNGP